MQNQIADESVRNMPVCVEADDRERRSGAFRALQARDDVDLQVRRLRLGDYLIDGRLRVERKTVRDLAISLFEGRLFRQASRLSSHEGQRACVIVEGPSRHWAGANASRESLRGTLVTLTLVFGLPVLRSRDGWESAEIMLLAAEQLRRAARPAAKLWGYKPKSRRRIQLLMLQAIPGVGPARARDLLDAFGDPVAVISAPEDELRRVSRIGPKLAARIRWAGSSAAERA